jgi:hypothetical protein
VAAALTCKIPNEVGSVRARRDLRRATSDRSAASPTKFPVLPPLLQPMGGSNVKPLEPAPLTLSRALAFAGSLLAMTRQLPAGKASAAAGV